MNEGESQVLTRKIVFRELTGLKILADWRWREGRREVAKIASVGVWLWRGVHVPLLVSRVFLLSLSQVYSFFFI